MTSTRRYGRESVNAPLRGPPTAPPNLPLPALPSVNPTTAPIPTKRTNGFSYGDLESPTEVSGRPTNGMHRSTPSTSTINSAHMSRDVSASSTYSSPATPSSGKGNSSKSVLTIALQKAQSAVLLDSANNVPAAVAAYTQSVRLLEEVMARVEDSAATWRMKEAYKAAQGIPRGETDSERRDRIKREERAAKREKARIEEAKRLKNIHDTYLERIQMLTSMSGSDGPSDTEEEVLPTSAYQAELEPDLPPHASARASMSTITPTNIVDRNSYGLGLAAMDISRPPELIAEGIGAALINAPPLEEEDESPPLRARPLSRSFPTILPPALPLPEPSYQLKLDINSSPAFRFSTGFDSVAEEETPHMGSDHFAHPYAYRAMDSPRSSVELLSTSSSRRGSDWSSEQDQRFADKPLPVPIPSPTSSQLSLPSTTSNVNERTPRPDSDRSSGVFNNSQLLVVPPPSSSAGAPSPASSVGSFDSIYSKDPIKRPEDAAPENTAKRRPSVAELILPKGSRKVSSASKTSSRLINPTTDNGTISQRRRSPNPDTIILPRLEGLPTSSKESFSMSRQSSKSSTGMEAPDGTEFGFLPAATSREGEANGHMRSRSASQPGRRPSLASIRQQPLPSSQLLPRGSQAYGSIRKVSAPVPYTNNSDPSTPDLVARYGYFDDLSASSRSESSQSGQAPGTPSTNSLPTMGTAQPQQLAGAMPAIQRALFAPVAAPRRPFQLMQRLRLSIQQGSYITPRLFASKAIWQAPSTKLTSLDTKIKCIDILLSGLEAIDRAGEVLLVARAVDQPAVSRSTSVKLLKELETFDSLLNDVQGTLNKKLGFIEAPNGKKSSNAFGALLPKLSRSFDRMSKNKSADVQAIYCEALGRLFAESQVFDRHLALSSGDVTPSPYTDLAADVRSGIDNNFKRVSDFYSKVILRFVLRDLGFLLDKHAKRALGWVAD